MRKSPVKPTPTRAAKVGKPLAIHVPNEAFSSLGGNGTARDRVNVVFQLRLYCLAVGTHDRAAGTKVYIDFLTEFGRHLRLFQESAAYATASRTKTVGADGRTGGSISDKVDMDAKYGFGETHSAEWLWRFQKTDRFYHDLMEKLDLNPIP